MPRLESTNNSFRNSWNARHQERVARAFLAGIATAARYSHAPNYWGDTQEITTAGYYHEYLDVPHGIWPSRD
jgi:hypothetical protein